VVEIFDIVGTIVSGWLTHRFDARFLLLALYYTVRGASLFLLPSLFSDTMHVNMLAFILFYGLDGVATVPPTMARCRTAFGEKASIVFGWVFASHQIRAAVAAAGVGVIRDQLAPTTCPGMPPDHCASSLRPCVLIRPRPVSSLVVGKRQTPAGHG